MTTKDVRISEQVAYQLVQFLRRYRADVEQLLKGASADGELLGYLEAMRYGDWRDAERLEQAIHKAIERSDELWRIKVS